MGKLSQFFFNNKINILLIVCWLIVVLLAVSYHEIWFDEIIAYHYVKIMQLNQLLQHLFELEGHPPLWYFLLYPFVKSGFSPNILQYFSVTFVFAAVCYFCFRSKFNFLVKFLFLFSTGMIYLLPVIARNYSLIPLFIFILADLYPNRHKHPILYSILLIVISQMHIILWGFCIVCSILFIYEFIEDNFKEKFYKERFKSHLLSVIFLAANFFLTFYLYRYLIFNHQEGELSLNIDFHLIKEFVMYIPIHLDFHGLYYYLFIYSFFYFCFVSFLFKQKIFFNSNFFVIFI